MLKTTARSAALALALVPILSACSNKASGAQAAVRDSLKDPDSAQFGEFYYNEGTGRGCLTVNARNSMGGYTGDQQAFVLYRANTWEVDDIREVSQDTCRSAFADDAR